MCNAKDNQYSKGYREGYFDGVRDTLGGKVKAVEESDFMKLPVKSMSLSPRAINCLIRAGCDCVADVTKLDEYTIATMRNLGPKSASEIGCWMEEHGVRYTAWSRYVKS